MITGQQLRRARERVPMTQADLAERFGVSVRTIGNWEHMPVVPAKYWDRVDEVFPAITPESPAPISAKAAVPSVADREWLANRLAETYARSRNVLLHGTTTDELADMYITVADNAPLALDIAEVSIALGVDSRLVRDLAEAVTNVVVESGTLSILAGMPGHDAMTNIIFRAAQIIQKASETNPATDEDVKVLRFVGPHFVGPDQDTGLRYAADTAVGGEDAIQKEQEGEPD